MKSPITIMMSAMVVLLVGTLCLLSYADIDQYYQPEKPSPPALEPHNAPATLPDEQTDESESLDYELTLLRMQVTHQLS